jgi:hypothetical protein
MTYATFYSGIWTYPEMASGILVACLPVSPRFFYAIKETCVFVRSSSTFASLLTSVTARKDTADSSVSRLQHLPKSSQLHDGSDDKNVAGTMPLAPKTVTSIHHSTETPRTSERDEDWYGIYVMKDYHVREVV